MRIKSELDDLLFENKIQPVGMGYIDCITMKESVSGFINSLTKLKVNVLAISWWCYCSIGGNIETGCPHGGGGPKSVYFDGWFSEMYQIPNNEIKHNSEVVPYIENIWPISKDYLPCLQPAFWLDVPDDWDNPFSKKANEESL